MRARRGACTRTRELGRVRVVLQFRGVRGARDGVALTFCRARWDRSPPPASSPPPRASRNPCRSSCTSPQSSNPACAPSPGARTWSGERGGAGQRGRGRVGGGGRFRDSTERRARATRRRDGGRAGGIAASRRTTRARRNARFDPEKADGKWRAPRVDVLIRAPEVHTIRSLLQGFLVGTGDDRHGANRRAGRPRRDVASRLRDDAHVGRTRGVCRCVVVN